MKKTGVTWKDRSPWMEIAEEKTKKGIGLRGAGEERKESGKELDWT